MADAQIIDGKAHAERLRKAVTAEVVRLKVEHGLQPGLAVVLVGDDPASQLYVKSKGEQSRAAGMYSVTHRLAADTSQDDLIAFRFDGAGVLEVGVLRFGGGLVELTVELAADGILGLEQARRIQPDLIILDIMLPGLDGFSVCRTITRESAVPIIILTALQDEAHRIAGLEL